MINLGIGRETSPEPSSLARAKRACQRGARAAPGRRADRRLWDLAYPMAFLLCLAVAFDAAAAERQASVAAQLAEGALWVHELLIAVLSEEGSRVSCQLTAKLWHRESRDEMIVMTEGLTQPWRYGTPSPPASIWKRQCRTPFSAPPVMSCSRCGIAWHRRFPQSHSAAAGPEGWG